MRIIAGQRRGHKIDGPRESGDTRPTSDLVRESLFNILGELVRDRLFVDLFAGTGAVGLEALSRGASQAIFVERDRENVGLIHRNIARLRFEGRAQVRHVDAYRWARSLRALDDRPIVVFLDPPYRDYEVKARLIRHTISGLIDQLPAGSAIALESGRLLDTQILPDFDSWDIRRYGNTQVAIRVSAVSPAPVRAAAHEVCLGDDASTVASQASAALELGETINGLARFREGEPAGEPLSSAARTEPRPPRITKSRSEGAGAWEDLDDSH